MEQELFSWKQWDEVASHVYQFYNVKLKKPIYAYKVGQEFSIATIDFERGILEFYVDNHVVATYEIGIEVRRQVSEKTGNTREKMVCVSLPLTQAENAEEDAIKLAIPLGGRYLGHTRQQETVVHLEVRYEELC